MTDAARQRSGRADAIVIADRSRDPELAAMYADDKSHRHRSLRHVPVSGQPRQPDVLIIAGTVTTKMAGPLVRLWEQMSEPKWSVAMGRRLSCFIELTPLSERRSATSAPSQ